MSWDQAALDRSSLKRAAQDIEDRYRGAFEGRDGRLRVGAGTANNIRTRSKSIEFYAEVEWDTSRLYNDVHVVVASRRWLSRRWERVRPVEDAVDEIEKQLTKWLHEGP